MTDNNEGDNTGSTGGGNGSPTGGSSGEAGQQRGSVLGFMLSNKVEAALWMTRMCTVVFSFLFLFPFFGGNSYGFYQRALISSAATSALRLHQRLPNFQFSRQYFGQLFMEDSCHYLVYSLIFISSYPITMVLIPVFLFALLHACTYTTNLLNIMGPQSLQFVRNMISKLQIQQVNILRFIACTEIFIMPAVFFMIFVGKCSLFLPILYYRFITLRYSSRRNPYCRTIFSEMKLTVEHFINRPQCPTFVRTACLKGIDIISRLAPQLA